MTRAFKSPADFRRWLEQHHADATELTVRLFKVHAMHRGIGYRQALDEALCFGWIDGVKRALDADSFTHRFTPRKKKSNWSAVNVKRVRELIAEGRMHSAGLAAFEARDTSGPAPYSFENRTVSLDAAAEKRFRTNRKAWAFFLAQPPGYRRTAAYLVMSAKRQDTRDRRLAQLIEDSANGLRIRQLR